MPSPLSSSKQSPLPKLISKQQGGFNFEYAKVLLGLLLSLAAIYYYHIEEDLQLFKLFSVAVFGFIVHSLLPINRRLIFVLALNALAILWLFGWIVGLGILVAGTSLFLVANLKISVNYRAILILILGGVLVVGKLGWIPFPELSNIATVIGGLFMFRTMVYLYEMQYEKKDPGLLLKLNYFFLLPNLIFVIFPVVDYKTFLRSYREKADILTAQKGLLWIMRGLFHLMLYRLIYYYLIPAPSEINSIYGLVQYMTMSYALIVRLSGIFHLSAGIICLFGFNLPVTFDNYFLATGFSDLWRRINIYWKDFMMKVFYFPLYFKFKKKNNLAIFSTVMVVFLINWILHQYQWFWVRGNFPIRVNDFLFWAIFGLLVALNSIYQKSRKRKKKKANTFSVIAAGTTSLQIMGMLAFMSILWSFWTSPSVTDWYQFLLRAGTVTSTQASRLFLSLCLILSLGILAHYIAFRFKRANISISNDGLTRLYAIGWLGAVLLATPIGITYVHQYTDIDTSPILETKLNAADEEQLFQGYYETLLIGNNLNSRMWEVENQRDQRVPQDRFQNTGILVSYPDRLEKTIIPDSDIIFKGSRLTTNSHGLRDREYPLQAPSGKLRIALIGGSSEMGSGVRDHETFENLVEDRLNQSPLWSEIGGLEIINFSVAGTHLPEQVGTTEQRIGLFQPDVLMYAIHPSEAARGLKSFVALIGSELVNSFPELTEIFTSAGVNETMSRSEKTRLLTPYLQELHEWGIKRIADYCQTNDIYPVVVFVPTLGVNQRKNVATKTQYMPDIMLRQGFYPLDLNDAFDGKDIADLKVAEWDNHPNAKAHELIAQKMTALLLQNEGFFDRINTHQLRSVNEEDK